MKKFFFSMAIVLSIQYASAQTPYPCTQIFDVVNNGNGGQGCPSDHPEDANYHRGGAISIRFTNPIGDAVSAPDVITVQRITNGVMEAAADMKFVVKSITSDRLIVTYCYYSANNLNLFNGAGATYVFTIQYDGLEVQACNPIPQGSPILPVKFASFVAEKNSRGISLKWETSSELNSSGFNVERKQGTGEWTVLAFIPSKSSEGFSAASLYYNYEDATKLNGITQYRLRQIDIDGKSSYSDIRSVRSNDELSAVSLFPNPSNGQVSILFDDQVTLHNIRIVDVAGRVVRSAEGVKNGHEVSGLGRGQYLLIVTNAKSNQTTTEKFIVQ